MKLLVAGDAVNAIDRLIERVTAVNKSHGPFEAVLCVGAFLPPKDSTQAQMMEFAQYVEGVKQPPIPVYFLSGMNDNLEVLGPARSCTEPTKLGPNLFYLGARGTFTLGGLNIAFLSGSFDQLAFSNDRDVEGGYSRADVEHLMDTATADGYAGVDILLTNEWPRGFTRHLMPSNYPDYGNKPKRLYMGSPVVATLTRALKPRYHFAGSESIFYARSPYRYPDAYHTTRFYGMGNVFENDKKNKYLYALNATPLSEIDRKTLEEHPPDTTDCPFDKVPLPKAATITQVKRPRNEGPPQHGGPGQTMLPGGIPMPQIPTPEPLHGNDGNNKRRRQRNPPPEPGDCWFCLANPKVEKHLIAAIGNEVYLALPKGGLVDDHVLIVPVSHHASYAGLPDNVRSEVEGYKKALKAYCGDGKTIIFFERFVRMRHDSQMHMHIQAVPISTAKPISALKETFEAEGQAYDMQFAPLRPDESLEDVVGNDQYFVAEFANGDRLVHITRPPQRQPLQFGREVVSRIMGCPDRADWKACKAANEQEESRLTNTFKKAFGPFDPEDE